MKKALKYIFGILLTFFIFICILTGVFIVKILSDKDSLIFDNTKLSSLSKLTSIEIYDFNDNKIKLDTSNHTPINKIKQETIDAFISIEDKNFYSHKGTNLKRIVKAGINNVISGSFKEGASTISQQLVKNTHLSSDKTLERKIKEIIITKKMEQELSKDEIMEAYLNIIYFGNGAYGITEAAELYFDKEPAELSIDESALLAGLIKAPSRYSPYTNPEKAKQRRDLVLNEMFKDGKITENEYNALINKEINIQDQTKNSINNINNNLYEKMAVEEACQVLGLNVKELKNFKIYTYKNPEISKLMQQTIDNDVFYPENSCGNTASGLSIILDNKTGAVEALCGKSDYELSLIKRQPGSAIKPILVYAPALEEGIISPATPILDEKININGYEPNNVGGFHGYVSARESICKSLNIPAIKILEKVGLENGKNFAEKAGINFHKQDNNYAIALGGFTEGIDLKTLTTSYLPFSNNGNYINSTFIREIRNNDGVVVYKHNVIPKQIMGSDTAYLLTDMLMSGVKNGTSKKLSTLPFQVAGKTGTVAVDGTNYNNDAISIAYTSNKTMGVWLGNYSMEKEFQLESTNNGGTYATAIIKDVFSKIYEKSMPEDFEKPTNTEWITLDRISLEDHLLIKANEQTPERFVVKELFAKRFSPQIVSENFKDYKINNLNVSSDGKYTYVSFDCDDYIDYLICAYVDNEEIVLDRISDNYDHFESKYCTADYGDNIMVYVKYKYDYDNNYNISKRFTVKNLTNNNQLFESLHSTNFSSLWV